MLIHWLCPKVDSADPEKHFFLKSEESSDYGANERNDDRRRRNDPYSHLGVGILLIMNMVILGFLVMLYRRPLISLEPKRMLDSPLPAFPNEVKTFKMNPLYLSLPTVESDSAWDRLTGPNGRGFVWLEGATGNSNDWDHKAGLSVFHQLHCLGAVRKFMWDLVYRREDPDELLRNWPVNVSVPTYSQAIHGLWHVSHCLDYIRQGVQCSGDTSLEFLRPDHAVTGLAIVDGFDWPHECKNWDMIWDYATQHA